MKQWKEPLLATQYGDACLVIDQSQLFPLNTTQSEDCLTLNIFTPGELHVHFYEIVLY